jgi:threonine/homoserine/homoserine lactone efflux protein
MLSVAAFAVSMAATPGPNNAMVAASGATFGFARTIPHVLGISIGFPVMIAAVALGAGAPLRSWPWLAGMLRWLGAGYLLWLAWHIATARPRGADEAREEGVARDRSRPLTFLQAALFQWVNPKAWVIAAGAVVTYTTARGGGFMLQALAVALIFLAITFPAVALWTAIGAGASRVLRSARALRAFNVCMAVLLVVSLVPMLRE